MRNRNPNHHITDTRDWARIVLAAAVGVALIILSAHGELSAVIVAAAAAVLR